MLIGNKILLPVGKWSSNQMLIYSIYFVKKVIMLAAHSAPNITIPLFLRFVVSPI